MKSKVMNNLSLLVTVFITIFTFQLVVMHFNNVIDERVAERIAVEELIDDYYKLQQEQYEASLSRVAEYIHSTDQYLNIGGQTASPEYIDSNIFESIMEQSEEQDFTEYLANVELFFSERTEYLDSLPSIWPLEYTPNLRITSQFGRRYDPFSDSIQEHTGIDLTSTYKADILVTAPGTIVEHWLWHPIFGKQIIVDHGNGYRTRYAHLSETYIHEWQTVERGEVIGRMGNTGRSNGMHLHYGVMKYNEETGEWDNIDPMSFMREAYEIES